MKTTRKATTALLALLTIMTICLSACAGTPSDTAAPEDSTAPVEDSAGPSGSEEHNPVTVTILHEHSPEAAENIVSSAAFATMVEKYKEEHPWVTLEETFVANSDIQDKYLALIAADDLPNVCYVKYAWLESMVGGEEKMLVDLSEYANPDDYMDGLFSVTYDGKIYGMENKYSVYNTILYNKALWAEAGYDTFPTTMDELLAANEYFDSKGIDTISLGNTAKWFAVSYFASPLLYDYCGKDWVDSMIYYDGTNHWTDQGFIDAMTTLQSMSGLFNADFNTQDDMFAIGWYMQGKAAAHAVGQWGLTTANNMKTDYPEVWENTGVALLPRANDASGTLVSASGAAVGVSSKCTGDVFTAAVELCQQISSQDYANYCAEHLTTSPVKIDVDFSAGDKPFQDLADILNSTSIGSGLNFNDYFAAGIVSEMQTNTQSLLAGSITPEQMATDMQAFQDAQQ